MQTIVFAEQQPVSGPSAFTGGGPVVLNDSHQIHIQAQLDQVTAGGTITIETSADGVIWSSHATTIVITGTTSAYADYNLYAKYMRITYADSGGVGDITVKMNITE